MDLLCPKMAECKAINCSHVIKHKEDDNCTYNKCKQIICLSYDKAIEKIKLSGTTEKEITAKMVIFTLKRGD